MMVGDSSTRVSRTILGLVHKKRIIRTRLMYHAACKVEFQPFKRLYSQLTFFNFLSKKKDGQPVVILRTGRLQRIPFFFL